MSPGA